MAFGDWGGGVVMALAQDPGDKFRNGDDCIGLGEEMFSSEGRAGAFGQVPGKDHQGRWAGQTGGQQGGPVIVPMVGVENPWAGDPKEAGKGQDLEGAEAGKLVEGEFGRLRGEGRIGGAGDFHRPTSLGQTVGKGEALVVRSATPQAGVELEHSGDQG
mgnify:CR=1 FL=1